jgi:hypothetical protein
MSDYRCKNVSWKLHTDSDNVLSWESVHAAILMDIRDELQDLNRLLRCPNFIAIPRKLDRISRNTAKPKRERR